MKKYKKSIPFLFLFIAVLLAAMTALNVLQTNNGDIIMNGIKATFGGNVTQVGSFLSVDVNFSFLNFIAFFGPLILSVLLVYYISNHKKVTSTTALLSILVMISFIASFIILMNLGTYTTGTAEIFGGDANYTYESAKLAIGAIFALVFAGAGALATLGYAVITFKD